MREYLFMTGSGVVSMPERGLGGGGEASSGGASAADPDPMDLDGEMEAPSTPPGQARDMDNLEWDADYDGAMLGSPSPGPYDEEKETPANKWRHLELICDQVEAQLLQMAEGTVIPKDDDKRHNILYNTRRFIPTCHELDDVGSRPTRRKVKHLRDANNLAELVAQMRYDTEADSFTNTTGVWAYLANAVEDGLKIVAIWVPKKSVKGDWSQRLAATDAVGNYNVFIPPVKNIARLFMEERKKLAAKSANGQVSYREVGRHVKNNFKFALPGRKITESNAHKWGQLCDNLFDVKTSGDLLPLYESFSRVCDLYPISTDCPLDTVTTLADLVAGEDKRVLIRFFDNFEEIQEKAARAHYARQAANNRPRTDFGWTGAMLKHELKIIRLQVMMIAKLDTCCTDCFDRSHLVLISEGDDADHERLAHLTPEPYRKYLVYRQSVEKMYEVRRQNFVSVLQERDVVDATAVNMALRRVFDATTVKLIFDAPTLTVPEVPEASKKRSLEDDDADGDLPGEDAVLKPYDWAMSFPWPPGEYYAKSKAREAKPVASIVLMQDLEEEVKKLTRGRAAFFYCDIPKISALTERDTVEPKQPKVTAKAAQHFVDGLNVMKKTTAAPRYFIGLCGEAKSNEIKNAMDTIRGMGDGGRHGMMITSDDSYKAGVIKTSPMAELFEQYFTNVDAVPATFRIEAADLRLKLLQRSSLDLQSVEEMGMPESGKVEDVMRLRSSGVSSIGPEDPSDPISYQCWFAKHRHWSFPKSLKQHLMEQPKNKKGSAKPQQVPVVVDWSFDELLCTYCLLMRMDYIGCALTPAHMEAKKHSVKQLWWWAKSTPVPLDGVSDIFRWNKEYINYTKQEGKSFNVRIMGDFLSYDVRRNTPGVNLSGCKNAASHESNVAKRRRVGAGSPGEEEVFDLLNEVDDLFEKAAPGGGASSSSSGTDNEGVKSKKYSGSL
ncbi:unnamed protein product [Amoebophrya sp. A25]|nr:unnamed protein product [Amoebophrya sp. A25]|eukprot:GSA25T00020242001.1